jgi:IS5 family transposase
MAAPARCQCDGVAWSRNDVAADSAYPSTKIETQLRASGYGSRIHRRGRRNHPLSSAQSKRTMPTAGYALVSSIHSERSRARRGGRIVRTIGMIGAPAKIGLQNLVYNICRLVTLERLAAA